jgi:uncharacterized protein YdeI (BOF family)
MSTPPDGLGAPPPMPRPQTGGGGGAKMVACPGCGASITLRALGQSVMVACPSCGTQIDVSRPDIRLIRKYNEQTRRLHVPLGVRGKLRGQTYEVIGAMQRSASGERWEEYLLFNPFVGFRWLVYDHGHWNLGQMIKDTSTVKPDVGRPYQGHVFRKYDQDVVVVDWVVGEFYWRVTTGEQVLAIDYISPPFMLSYEKADGEITWTYLEYLEPREVEAAFHIECPDRLSLGVNQPNSASQALRSIRTLSLLAIGLAFLIQVVTAAATRSTYFDMGSYDLIHTASQETQVYGPFTLQARHSVNQLSASAPLDNAWVELQGNLVNTDTGQSFPFADTFQYYHGYDSDGSWSDGSGHGNAMIGSVPAGTYNLVIAGSSGDKNGRPVAAAVQIGFEHNLTTWRNFWIAVALILVYPIWLLIRSATYERQRWSDSRYALPSILQRQT